MFSLFKKSKYATEELTSDTCTIQLRELDVPQEYLSEVFALIDEYRRRNTTLSFYELWKYIERILPETKEGRWKITVPKATRITVVERVED